MPTTMSSDEFLNIKKKQQHFDTCKPLAVPFWKQNESNFIEIQAI